MFTGEMDELNTQQQSQDLYRYVPHPLYIRPKSIEAHHLICSEAMSSKRWRTFCKMTGYNINCYLNGVFLPADLPLACAARLPLHSGGHSLGFAGRSQNRRVSYVTQVKKEVLDILTDARDHEICKSADGLKELVNRLNRLSNNIFNKVKNFEWTITWDGFDYQPGNPIGCANQVSIQDKKGTRRIRKEDGTSVKVEYSEEMKKMQSSLKTATGFREKIASIEDVERKQDMVGKFFEKIKKDKKILCTCSRKHDEIEKIDKPYTNLKLGE